ncbi:YtxH domain-containing protein [Solitalea sp. MAHUQ-68]|uniref:YtxH domain-containing protein n=1 Tax=Solitalea agri TaxID=2953739 RepID=A0A9X2FA16_9SPHI|nr:YtxH domain-containing protein [Solitalea agri]MCO4294648.1 YtxH domain-containing protein [Solitalea agri]
MNETRSIAAFFTGLCVGVAIGALFTSEKGTDFRNRVVDKLKQTGEDVLDSVKDGIKEVSGFSSKTSSENPLG